MHLSIDFRHAGVDGRVVVTCVPNGDPGRVGKGEEARGFPACTATIDYPAEGYRALFGWVQLVRSTDNASGGTAFENDPLQFFEDSPAPYCWYGLRPILFDAPSRDDRSPMLWLAHSFLCVTPRDAGTRREVVPVLGFSWGFRIATPDRIDLDPVLKLAPQDWNDHLPYLRSSFPTWEFAGSSLLS